MRNLDIGDTRAKLETYIKVGLLAPSKDVPRLEGQEGQERREGRDGKINN
jgi:hypothetical protein